MSVRTQVPSVADLLSLKELFYAASAASGSAARRGSLTADLVDDVATAGDAVGAACEAFRRARFPRSSRVVCANGEVWVLSAAGRAPRRIEA